MDNAINNQADGRPQRPARSLQAALRALAGRQELVIFGLLVVVAAGLSLQTDTFLTSRNLLNLARAFSWIAIAAFGQSLVIMIGGIDLSAGAVMALSGLVCALCLEARAPAPAAIVAGLLAGSLVGATNGVLVGRMRLPPFIVTLGTMNVARGLTLGLTDGEPLRNLPLDFRALGQAEVGGGALRLGLPVIYMLTFALMVGALLNWTVLGRYVYTLGRNERALTVAGVPTDRLKVLIYTVCGLLTAVGGLIMTARVGVAAPTAAVGYELDIIAAAVIGGTSFFGGEGGVTGVLLGTALMQVVRNGMVLMGVPGQWQAVAIGAMILLVIVVDDWRRRRVP